MFDDLDFYIYNPSRFGALSLHTVSHGSRYRADMQYRSGQQYASSYLALSTHSKRKNLFCIYNGIMNLYQADGKIGLAIVEEDVDSEFDLTKKCEAAGVVPLTYMSVARQFMSIKALRKVKWELDVVNKRIVEKSTGKYLGFLDDFPVLKEKDEGDARVQFKKWVLIIKHRDRYLINCKNGKPFDEKNDTFEHQNAEDFLISFKKNEKGHMMIIGPGNTYLTAGEMCAFKKFDKSSEGKTQWWRIKKINDTEQLYNDYTELYFNFQNQKLVGTEYPGVIRVLTEHIDMESFIGAKAHELHDKRVKAYNNRTARALDIGRQMQKESRERYENFYEAWDAAKEASDDLDDGAGKIIQKYALLAASGNLVPVPGLGIAIDIGAIASMASALANYYKTNFSGENFRNLVETKLKTKLKKHLEKTAKKKLQEKFHQHIGPCLANALAKSSNSYVRMASEQYIKKYVTKHAASNAGSQSAKTSSKWIPGVGQIIGATVGFYFAASAGKELMREYKQEYLKNLDASFKERFAKGDF